VDHPQLDWAWHVPEYDLRPVGPAGPGGSVAAVHRLIAELAATQLPDDRPMWRLGLVRAEPDCAAVLLVHHAWPTASVSSVRRGIDQHAPVRTRSGCADAPPPPGAHRGRDRHRSGPARHRWTSDRPLPGGGTPDRRFCGASVELELLRPPRTARRSRITDIVLSAVAGGLRRMHPDPDGLPANLRSRCRSRPGPWLERGETAPRVVTDVPLGE
jgi:hypothetical protein